MEWLGYPATKTYQGLDITDLPLNHAWVIANTTLHNVSVFSVTDDCFNCPYKLEKHLTPNQLEAWKVDVSHLASWRIKINQREVDTLKLNKKSGWLCQMRPTFHEYGVYRLDIGTCQLRPEVQPANTYYPLILTSVALLLLCCIHTGINYLCKYRKVKNEQSVNENNEKTMPTDKETMDTVSTFDVYKGVLLALVIFLTTGGGGYPIFCNVWGGLTLAECTFFAYIWSIGVKIPTVMGRAVKEKSKCAVLRDIVVRSFLLILLGTAIDSTVEDQHSNLRLWLPLQKIGMAYFFVATAYVLTVQKFEMKSKIIFCKVISDIVTLMWCWVIAGFVLAIFGILISTFMSFNCLGNVHLLDTRAEEMDIVDEDTSQNCNNMATEYANKIFVGDSQKIVNVNQYLGFSRGIMGIISAVMYMMVGLKAGVVYHKHQSHADRLKLWTLWATLFGIGGICFAVASFYLDFNLWPITSIFVVTTIATYLFGVVYLLTDVLGVSSNILSSLGVTSLVILCGHMLFSNTLPFTWGIHFKNHLLYLLQNLWIVFLWLIIAVFLKKRNVRFEM